MPVRLIVLASAMALGIICAGALSGGSASAHEHRAVGNYEFVVGFLNEPAIAYEPNGLDLRITFFEGGVPVEGEAGEDAEEEGVPVEGAEETLQAEVIVGGGANTLELDLEPHFGQPGAYAARFIPTYIGDYTFHVFGELDGMQIDEEFSSGPETFSSIEDPGELMFPDQVPSNAELAQQIGDSDGSDDDSDTATILAIVAIAIGVAALAAAGYAVATRRLR